jgi:hypothetical protein
MLRWTVPILIVFAVIEPAAAADRSPVRPSKHQGKHVGAGKLPAGLPRPHYVSRTTIVPNAPYPPRRYLAHPPHVDETSELLFTPTDEPLGYIAPLVRAPLLPGSSTLPGYYGSSYSYGYQGPYYGGPNPGFWDRLPYACGVFGYC